MGTIQTNSILTVDLNCFLFKFEEIMAEFSSILGKISEMEKYAEYSLKRKNAIHQFFFSNITH
jgi:neutral trehalase